MRRFTHTFPQRISAFLLCLALLVGLLPVTALAADGIDLYVGGQLITESGCYANQNGTWTKVDGTEPANGQFSYDAATFTLTLNQAEITHDQTVKVAEGYTYEGSVIAFSQTAEVSLKIVVSQGTSTITGKGGIRVESTTGNASLSIKGPGSLDVEPNGSNSGITLCSSKNTNLDIDGADVTASSPAHYGVYLISSTDASSTSTITVNNCSLTTGGNGNVGIYYYWSGTNNAGTSSLTVSGNAVVDTRNSQIMAQNKETVVQVGAGSDGNGGIVFNGKSGTVYGDVTLQEDLEIGTDETLTIRKDASLTVPDGKTLTNDGTVTTEEGGTLTGNITNAPPKINTTNPLPDGTVGTVYNQQLAAENTPTQWSVTSGPLPAGLTLNGNTISGTPTTANTYKFTVTATNNSGSDSKEFTLTINPAPVLVTGVTLAPTSLSLFTGDTAPLTATVQPADATNKTVNWSSSDEAVATVDSTGKVTAVGAGKATITVTTADGSHTATCTVTVEKPYTPPPYIPPTYAVTVPETTGGTVEVSPSRASSGRRVTITATPDLGYELESLTVLDSRGSEIALTAQGDGKFTFTMPSRKVTVQASFAPVPLPFEDVAPGAWYESAVRYAYTHGIMEGTSATTFVPGKSLTRAEAVQVLYNLEGQPTVSESATFPDLVYQWYKPAIAWAESTGVVDGYEDGTFQPGQPVTRQEFAQMLYDYAAYKDYDLTAEGDLSAFPDGDSVQEWALSAMTWANGNALINGHDDGTLEPGGTTTRAQAASILMRFDQNVVEN